jgi:hypothetical protein
VEACVTHRCACCSPVVVPCAMVRENGAREWGLWSCQGPTEGVEGVEGGRQGWKAVVAQLSTTEGVAVCGVAKPLVGAAPSRPAVTQATSPAACAIHLWSGRCRDMPCCGVLWCLLQVSRAVRDSLTVRAADFGIVLEDIAITHLSFGTEFTKVGVAGRVQPLLPRRVAMQLGSLGAVEACCRPA